MPCHPGLRESGCDQGRGDRERGSHIPNHMETVSVRDRKVAKRTLRNLIRAAGLTAEAFVAESEKV